MSERGHRVGRTTRPTLLTEHELFATGAPLVIGVDEVGRGALAGPVMVGAVAVTSESCAAAAPVRIADSKLVAPGRRPAIAREIEGWAAAAAVGAATSREIDRFGLSASLGLAGRRALALLGERLDLDPNGGPARGDQPAFRVLLDGRHDWLSTSLGVPNAGAQGPGAVKPDPPENGAPEPREVFVDPRIVHTLVKADLHCVSVAAASIVAKVARDGLLVELARRFPVYGWERNKGYGSGAHLAALRKHGPCEQHRLTWKLPAQEAVA